MIHRITRWLRMRVLRAELREIDLEEQRNKNAISCAWLRRQQRQQELDELEDEQMHDPRGEWPLFLAFMLGCAGVLVAFVLFGLPA